MSFSRRAGFRPAALAIATAAVTVIALSPPGPVAAAPAAATAGTYLIQFEGAPLTAYTGGVSGIAATRAATGAKIDRKSWNYQAYRQYLKGKRAEVLNRAKIAKSRQVAEYDTVINGVAATLTADEVAKLNRTPGVVKLWKNEIFKLTTVSTPRFLGLEGSGGVWNEQFGDPSKAGLGTIIGVVDSGIWPENPSFAALPEPRPDADTIAAKWSGECQPGTDNREYPDVTCNNKLIGARYYDFGAPKYGPDDFRSPRDSDGHGSHTASTAAGNYGVPATINDIAVGNVSGMAPAARIAAYKVCYSNGCGGLEIAAAIDDAVADGVDVINFSISGSASSLTDLIESAFFQAAAAGVFVSASAGNNGPGPSTVAHNGPWNMTVAASTHDRFSAKSVTLGNGATYSGAGNGGAFGPAPLVDAVNAGLPGADPVKLAQCWPANENGGVAVLDPAKVTGKIVLCARGGSSRVGKSLAVKEAGGVGMIHHNTDDSQSINADYHFVPTVHINATAGLAVKAYIASTAAPAASFSAAVPQTVRAPQMASFSSRGPSFAGNGDLLKPDVTAPGVDIIAAVSPVGHSGNLHDSLQGTSMSGPHVAGIALLLRSKHPTWSPMAVKSAIMTSATTRDNTNQQIPATPLDYGNGHVHPAGAFDPGLVYESGPLDWLQYTCGAGQHQSLGDGSDVCDVVGQIDPSDFNNASIAIGDLAGRQTVTRTVSNTTNQASVYVPRVEAPAGFTVKVTPSVLTVLPRRSATYTVEITRTTAALNTWAFGSLTLADLRGHSVRSAIAVQPTQISAVAEVTESGASGSVVVPVRANYNGTLGARPAGMIPSTVTSKHVEGTDSGFSPTQPSEIPGVAKFSVTVPAGVTARFATFDSDYQRGTDLDMFVYKEGAPPNQVPFRTSTGGSAEEAVTISEPGNYTIYLSVFALPEGVDEVDVKFHSWLLGSAPAGNLTVSPASQPVTVGGAAQATATWSGLTPGVKYLGAIDWVNGSAVLDRTVIQVQA
ncbi:hypothetical protein GCM10009557_49960 [Virgisporangium ochraceum]|uniref:Uncharacterized protein n=1 Tax=Virgisporangium ochraceum TaxID=65505 RepID=A0A8J3ZU95_9ACTN|nr:S8 family serine peptidase [Virgisporangium ochraceum]GIJ70019.1 hypothetical protein Voc01_049360 [Virgisporangium ochraceum]